EAISKDIIDQTLKTYLIKKHRIMPTFYILPKIHKRLVDPTGRPIVANSESALQPLSVFVDRMLQPFV
ncbi:Hypothetical predicted protein, partial [Pelobates cultripes]